eukprot:UN07996
MSANKNGNLTSSAIVGHKSKKPTNVMSFNEYYARHQHLLSNEPSNTANTTNLNGFPPLIPLEPIAPISSIASIASIASRSICSEPEEKSIDIASLQRAYSIDSCNGIPMKST